MRFGRSEDYQTGKVKNVSDLHSGKLQLETVTTETINKLYDTYHCDVAEIMGKKKPMNNTFYILKSNKNSGFRFYNAITNQIDKVEKKPAYGVMPKNA